MLSNTYGVGRERKNYYLVGGKSMQSVVKAQV